MTGGAPTGRRVGVGLAVAALVALAGWGGAVALTGAPGRDAAPEPALVTQDPLVGSDAPGYPAASPEPEAPVVPPAPRLPAPTGDLPGWRSVFVDDFDRTELGDDWGAYSGRPGGDRYSLWAPSQVLLGDGSLRLRTERVDGRWLSGGVSNFPVSRTYGKWEVQVRVDPSDEVAYHLLLWPQDEVWPPEVDFAESFDGTRQTLNAFVHSDEGVEDASLRVDMSQWHVVGVEWEPGVLRFTVDGQVWHETTEPGTVPDAPMWLALQSSSAACQRSIEFDSPFEGCSLTDVPPVADVEVDWVAVYARS